MSNRRMGNLNINTFINRIGKLQVGQTVRYCKIAEDGTVKTIASVTCDTIGVRPRTFSIICAYGGGSGYTYRQVMTKILKNIFLSEKLMKIID